VWFSTVVNSPESSGAETEQAKMFAPSADMYAAVRLAAGILGVDSKLGLPAVVCVLFLSRTLYHDLHGPRSCGIRTFPLSGFSSEWLQQFTSVCTAWLQRTSLNCVRPSLRQQVVVVGFGPPQPAIWSYHAADCQPTAPVLSVSLVGMGTLNLREWTLREWTIRHDVAGVDIAGVDNAAPCDKGGQCGSGQCRSGEMRVKMCNTVMTGKELMAY